MLSKTHSSAASRRLFLRAQGGKLSSSRGTFTSISGGISKVEYKEHVDDKGQHYYNWHLLIDDAEHGEYYDVAFSKFCDGFGYLLSALLIKEGQNSLSNLTIDFSPYKATGTRAVVSAGGRSDEVSVFEEPYLEKETGRVYPDILAVVRCGGALFSAPSR